jgi:hypothetical protein
MSRDRRRRRDERLAAGGGDLGVPPPGRPWPRCSVCGQPVIYIAATLESARQAGQPVLHVCDLCLADGKRPGGEAADRPGDGDSALSRRETELLVLAVLTARAETGQSASEDELQKFVADCDYYRHMNALVDLVLQGRVRVDVGPDGTATYAEADPDYTERFRRAIEGVGG